MLDHEAREKIRQHIARLMEEVRTDARAAQSAGVRGRARIDQAVRTTVSRLAPESQMLLSDIYNILVKKTLAKDLYRIQRNKAAFYERNIRKDLNAKFVFDIPVQIDYEESKVVVNRWIGAGAVLLVGGVISISMETLVPIGIAVVLAGLMVVLLGDGSLLRGRADDSKVGALLCAYFQNVEQSLLVWVDSIAAYYDAEIAELERKLVEECI